MVKSIESFPERFRAVAPRLNTGQSFHKRTRAGTTKKPATMDLQMGDTTKALKVANTSQITSFAQKPTTGAVAAKLGVTGRLKMHLKPIAFELLF